MGVLAISLFWHHLLEEVHRKSAMACGPTGQPQDGDDTTKFWVSGEKNKPNLLSTACYEERLDLYCAANIVDWWMINSTHLGLFCWLATHISQRNATTQKNAILSCHHNAVQVQVLNVKIVNGCGWKQYFGVLAGCTNSKQMLQPLPVDLYMFYHNLLVHLKFLFITKSVSMAAASRVSP